MILFFYMEFQDGNSYIKTRNLVKQYGKRRVVKGVNIDLRAGEIVGLLGPNGAGKTTSFYMIVGLVPATEGEVFLDGADITEVPIYKRARMGIGYLPQEPSVFRKLTVRQNILAVAENLPIPKGELKDFVQSMLEELNLSHLADQPAFTLSGGERRRLEITRALTARPKFLLMDEPFSGVDPISVAEVQDIIRGYPTDCMETERPEYRYSDNRPQCARNPKYSRPRIPDTRRNSFMRGHERIPRQRRTKPKILSRRKFLDVARLSIRAKGKQ